MAKAQTKTRDMTVGSPLKHIIAFAIPLLGGIIFQQLYSMVDSMIVGKLLGADALAAVGCTGNITFLIIGLCMGTCTGFSIPVSQYFGAKDERNMKKCVGNSIWLTAIISLVFAVTTVLFCRQILTIMKTPADILDQAYSYLVIIFAGIPASILYNLLSAYLRALGNSKTPLVFVIISSILNIILDVSFIVVFKMGVSGAAWATIISQAVSGIACLVYIIKKFEPLHVKKEDLLPDRRIVGRLIGAGLPMGMQFSITAFGGSILQVFINGLGTAAVAAFSAGMRVGGLFGCMFDALGSTMSTYCGQNVGAGKADRLRKGIITAVLLGWGYSLLLFLIMFFFGKYLSLLFLNKDETEIIRMCAMYLVRESAFFFLLTIVNTVRPSIQGMGYASIAVFAGIMELFGRAFVGLFIVPRFGFVGACYGSPIAWLAANLFLVPCCFIILNHLKKKLAARSIS